MSRSSATRSSNDVPEPQAQMFGVVFGKAEFYKCVDRGIKRMAQTLDESEDGIAGCVVDAGNVSSTLASSSTWSSKLTRSTGTRVSPVPWWS